MEKQVIEEKISLLNKMGYQIVEINNHYYQFTGFIGYSQHVNKTTLVGKDISFLLINNSLPLNQSNFSSQIENVKNNLNNLPTQKIEFSPNFPYIVYLNSL